VPVLLYKEDCHEKEPLHGEQIIAALKEHEAGARVPDLCRKLGVSQHTFYRWRSKYGGMEVSDARKLKALEEEYSHRCRGLAQ
jgi:putative transposase